MSFKAIETQEEFDAIVKERIARAEKAAKKEFEGYMSPEEVEALKSTYETKLGEQKNYEGFVSPKDVESLKQGYESQISSLKLDNDRIMVAHEKNLPLEVAIRLNGANKEELEADADSLINAFGLNQSKAWPSAQAEQPIGDVNESDEALTQMFENLNI